MSERTLIVARDAASRLGCSPRTVRELARRASGGRFVFTHEGDDGRIYWNE